MFGLGSLSLLAMPLMLSLLMLLFDRTAHGMLVLLGAVARWLLVLLPPGSARPPPFAPGAFDPLALAETSALRALPCLAGVACLVGIGSNRLGGGLACLVWLAGMPLTGGWPEAVLLPGLASAAGLAVLGGGPRAAETGSASGGRGSRSSSRRDSAGPAGRSPG
ncbi:hypothetical protein [Rhizosaccharibacter radicis]|uniref:Uncharacterized protein n=1 Tax=Rhizosaccharibacter radicis TaxID=2782605 RepID=A0ABT1W120_9PROT|nr:hypothetical protein [Acetobacteraceae bacterium KSS12]